MTDKILLDTNSYLRLAEPLHPLLGQEIGKSKFRMQILKELNGEVKKSPRLQTRFPWFTNPEFEQNRQYIFRVSKKNLESIDDAENHLWEYKKSNELSTSLIDIKCLAYGLIIPVTVITDDSDMLQIAKEFEIDSMKTIELLHELVQDNGIYEEQIEQVLQYWIAKDDLPKDIVKDALRLFGKKWDL